MNKTVYIEKKSTIIGDQSKLQKSSSKDWTTIDSIWLIHNMDMVKPRQERRIKLQSHFLSRCLIDENGRDNKRKCWS